MMANEHDHPENDPSILKLPDRIDWTGIAIDRLDVNRLPEGLRESASQLVRGAAARRGVAFPRPMKATEETRDD